MVYEQRRDHYTISTDKTRLDVATIHDFLTHSSYWAQGRTVDAVQRSIDNSLCFGVYDGTQQAGFARVVTDYVAFGWLCDVFILPSHRGHGLGKWLVECITAHPDLTGLRTLLLATRDAHGLYAGYGGFKPLENPAGWMVKRPTPPAQT
jgi:GNAT superfamily N-acetyltransferase